MLALTFETFRQLTVDGFFRGCSFGLLGVGFARLILVENDVGRVIPSMRVWHPRWFRYDYERRTWRVKTTAFGNEEEDVQAGDGKWIVFTPYGESRPWARGAWQGLGLLAIRQRSRAPERLAWPPSRIKKAATPCRSAATASRRVAVKSNAWGSP